MLHPIAGALLIAAVLVAYTLHTILSYKPRHARRDNLPSQQFLRSFAEPISHVTVVAQVVGHHEERTSVDFDWSLLAEESLTGHRIHVPTGAEFDAAEAKVAAVVDINEPAKRVRVYHLAADLGVDTKFLRGVMDHQFGISTKSPSSTISALQALTVTEFFHTHAEV